MEQETKRYLEKWGHLPFWEDPEGFKKRVKITEEKSKTTYKLPTETPTQ